VSQGPVPLRLSLEWGELAALAWPRPGATHALCLHGWMDNAASFEPLAPHLECLDLVALEFAGHGHSDHRPSGTQYYFSDYMFEVDAALDALGWETCTLIGHSLGGAVACNFAVAAPERVERLVLLDGVGVIAEPAEAAAARLARSLKSVRRSKVHRRVLPDPEAGARLRRQNNPMAFDSALALTRRALQGQAGALRWRTDPRIMWTSPLLPTEPQALELLRAVTCPTLVITTPVLAGYLGAHLDARLGSLAEGRHAVVEGGHHVHMDDPASVAPLVLDFLKTDGAIQ